MIYLFLVRSFLGRLQLDCSDYKIKFSVLKYFFFKHTYKKVLYLPGKKNPEAEVSVTVALRAMVAVWR